MTLPSIYLNGIWLAHQHVCSTEQAEAMARAAVERHLQDHPELGEVLWNVDWRCVDFEAYGQPSGLRIVLMQEGMGVHRNLDRTKKLHWQMMMMTAQLRGQRMHVWLQNGIIVDMWPVFEGVGA